MRLGTVIVAGAVLLAVTSLAGSKNANGTPRFQDPAGDGQG